MKVILLWHSELCLLNKMHSPLFPLASEELRQFCVQKERQGQIREKFLGGCLVCRNDFLIFVFQEKDVNGEKLLRIIVCILYVHEFLCNKGTHSFYAIFICFSNITRRILFVK
jgi:hypothetical protein